jgi:hypothetical protein
MPVFLRHIALCVLVLGLLLGYTTRSAAQAAPGAEDREQVISANPFGLLLDVFNAEYERRVTPGSTAGVGGSFYLREDQENYFNLDGFWRFYPSGRAFHDWAFGLKAGVTNVPGSGSFFGAGFDVNRSWILGANDNFYVGVGFGLKRLYGPGVGDLDLRLIPTLRIVNVGVAF